MDKKVQNQGEWSRVRAELAAEDLKPAVYDSTLVELAGEVNGEDILDYGAGPGVLARTMQLLGANVKIYDISPDMRRSAGEKIGHENTYGSVKKIPQGFFNLIVCNLVLCIVDEGVVVEILNNIRRALKPGGKALMGFCNPLIFNVPESQLDYRDQDGLAYHEHRTYWKTKKEGKYRIIEIHRPISWYTRMFEEVGFRLTGIHFTPEYQMQGRRIQDFIIFELKREGGSS